MTMRHHFITAEQLATVNAARLQLLDLGDEKTAALLNWALALEQACRTCKGNGLIGGPSFYAPDEGGAPCPDCAAPEPVALTEDQFAGKLNELERFAGNLSVLHHQYMGKAMPDQVYESFARLRDDVIPALKREIRAALAASQPAPVEDRQCDEEDCAKCYPRAAPVADDERRALIERLSKRTDFWSMDGVRWYGSSEPDTDCRRAAELLAAPAEAQAVPDIDLEIGSTAGRILIAWLAPDPETGECNPIRLLLGDGHAGPGLYVADGEYPEEGSTFLVPLGAAAPAPSEGEVHE